jgi:hypothetical protein
MRTQTDQIVRYVAVAAAGLTALLYVLIGFEVLFIGEAASGGNADLLAFGLLTGGAFAVIAALLAFAARRLVWIPVALLTLAVIVAYFAFAELRQPPFAFWGLAVKAVQVVLFGSVGYLAIRGAAGGPAATRAAG